MDHAEIPNLITLLAEHIKSPAIAKYLYEWENIIFSIIAVAVISFIAYLASRKPKLVPSRLQAAFEVLVSGVDNFVCGIIGPKGRMYTPFIGTLFIYILFMNLFGLVPFMKSSTTSWSVTLALAITVFIYVQYAGIKELGFLGYIDHLLGKPRGIMAFSVVMPLMMLFLHAV